MFSIGVRRKADLIGLPSCCSVRSNVALPPILQSRREDGSSSVLLCVSVGRQTTAPASVSAVAGTTGGIVEQGNPASLITGHSSVLSTPFKLFLLLRLFLPSMLLKRLLR